MCSGSWTWRIKYAMKEIGRRSELKPLAFAVISHNRHENTHLQNLKKYEFQFMYDSFRLLITKVSRNTSSCISSSFDWIWSISNHQKLSQHMLLYMFRSGINDSHSTLLFFSVHINCYHSLRYRARRFREDATKIGAHSVHAFDIPDVFSKALDDVETAHVQKINSLELHTAGQQWHAARQQCHGSPQAAKSTGAFRCSNPQSKKVWQRILSEDTGPSCAKLKKGVSILIISKLYNHWQILWWSLVLHILIDCG